MYLYDVYARLILLINVFKDGANSSSRRRLNKKVNIVNCIFGYQLRKQNFSTFHMCMLFWYFCKISFGRDLGTEYIVATVFQSYPTKKMSPMFTKKGYSND